MKTMKTMKTVIAEKYIKEAIAITSTNIMKYFKLIQKELGATSFNISTVKNGLWQVGFIHPRHLEGNLYLLMKNKNNGSKVGVAHAIGYNIDTQDTDNMLDSYHMLPHTVRKFSDLKMSIRILQNLKSLTKDAKTLSNQFDTAAAPDLEKDINANQIKTLQTSTAGLSSEMFMPFEEDLIELGVKKIELDIPDVVGVNQKGKNLVLVFPTKTSPRINIKIDSKIAYIIDFSKGNLNITSAIKNTELDALIHTIVGEYKFNVIVYIVKENDGYKIKSDMNMVCNLLFEKMPPALTSHILLSFIFIINENLILQLVEDKISDKGYEYGESPYFDATGLSGWVISDTFIESSKVG